MHVFITAYQPPHTYLQTSHPGVSHHLLPTAFPGGPGRASHDMRRPPPSRRGCSECRGGTSERPAPQGAGPTPAPAVQRQGTPGQWWGGGYRQGLLVVGMGSLWDTDGAVWEGGGGSIDSPATAPRKGKCRQRRRRRNTLTSQSVRREYGKSGGGVVVPPPTTGFRGFPYSHPGRHGDTDLFGIGISQAIEMDRRSVTGNLMQNEDSSIYDRKRPMLKTYICSCIFILWGYQRMCV